jgi:hypothetical protein
MGLINSEFRDDLREFLRDIHGGIEIKRDALVFIRDSNVRFNSFRNFRCVRGHCVGYNPFRSS